MSSETKDWNPTVFVLGPGGVKGFLELGALLLLEEMGYLANVKAYTGVSVGAVISLLLTAGYTVTEIIQDALEINLLQDFTSISLVDVQANAGLVSNRPVRDRLVLRLSEKFGRVPTLGQLYMATGIIWTAVSFNLDRDRAEFHSKDSDPNLSCVDAALLSMNIPILFYRLEYKRCVHIDGTFGNSYPIDHHDDGSCDIFGMYITNDRPETHVPVATSLLLYLYRTLDAPMSQIRKRIMANASSRCKHLELYTDIIDTAGFSVSREMKIKMINDGYQRAQYFLASLGDDSEIVIYDGVEPIERADNGEYIAPQEDRSEESDNTEEYNPLVERSPTPPPRTSSLLLRHED